MNSALKKAVAFWLALTMFMAVSYTHLDVYKRQLPLRAALKSSAS